MTTQTGTAAEWVSTVPLVLILSVNVWVQGTTLEGPADHRLQDQGEGGGGLISGGRGRSGVQWISS